MKTTRHIASWITGLVLVVTCASGSFAADPTIWHVKAVAPEGKLLDVKAVDKAGKKHDVKALEEDGTFYGVKVAAHVKALPQVAGQGK